MQDVAAPQFQAPFQTQPVNQNLISGQPASAANLQPQTNPEMPMQHAQTANFEVKRQQPMQALTLPTYKARRDESNYVSIDADTYQAAILNVKLPTGFKLECDYIILKTIEKKKQLEKINRKLEQKAEKARLIQEEKNKRMNASKQHTVQREYEAKPFHE